MDLKSAVILHLPAQIWRSCTVQKEVEEAESDVKYSEVIPLGEHCPLLCFRLPTSAGTKESLIIQLLPFTEFHRGNLLIEEK